MVPITMVFLWVCARVAGRSMRNMLVPHSLMTTLVALLDAQVLMIPAARHAVYHPSDEVALYTAVWIIWGLGIAMLSALVLPPRAQ